MIFFLDLAPVNMENCSLYNRLFMLEEPLHAPPAFLFPFLEDTNSILSTFPNRTCFLNLDFNLSRSVILNQGVARSFEGYQEV